VCWLQTGVVNLRGSAAQEVGIPAWRQAICYVADIGPQLTISAEAAFNRALGFRSQRTASRTAASPPSLSSFRDIVTRLGLDRDALQRPVHSLSAGERQRVALSWALALQPLVLLLDEPTSHLDRAATASFEQLLHERHLSVVCLLLRETLAFMSAQAVAQKR
jgi:ABC-type iron transport system FetAB ATPase subunit